jgi:signal transduction histidine kinase/ligand-binding sensor domain-containing protein
VEIFRPANYHLFIRDAGVYRGNIVISLRTLPLVLVLLGMFWARASGAENSGFLVTNWRNEDGLPHSIVNSVIQTRDGYLWIGTYVGLVRFDGVRFVHYTPSTIPELGDGRVANLFEGRDGTLWIALESGRLLAWKNGAVRVHPTDGDAPLAPVATLLEDAGGIIWLQTFSGQFGRLTANGVELLANTGEAAWRSSRTLMLDANQQLWANTSGGLKIWRNGKFETPEAFASELRGGMEAVAPARDGSIWAFRNRQLWQLSERGVLARIDVPEEAVHAFNLLEGADGRVWLTELNGGVFCRETSGQWREVSRQSFSGANRTLYEDREGNVWRGSFGGGLARIRPRLFAVHALPDSHNDRYARSASADAAGNVWAILNGQALAQIPAGQQAPHPVLAQNAPQGIRTVFVDRRNNLWVGSYAGARLYQMQGEVFRAALNTNFDGEVVSAIYEDAETNLWIGSTGGAGVGVMPGGDPDKWRVIEGMPYPDVRAIVRAADGSMWFGTHYGGVCRWKDGRWTQFTTKDGLPSDYVRCLFAEADGTLWLGTLHGLCRWREGKFVAITSAHGLWNDSLSHIAEDARGNFWLSSFGGIFRVNRQMLNDFAEGKRDSIQCVGYGRADGLPSVECPGTCQPAGTTTPDGRLWIPTVTGLVSVAPNEIVENQLPPPVWIEELGIDGKATVINPTTASITVPPGKRRFDFRFTALSLTAPERVQFRYKLSGLDENWSLAQPQRTAAYNYIPPGEYTFEVVACNNDGIWNESGHSLRLEIQPFFWQTWWFKLAVGGGLVLALVLGVRQAERLRARIKLERLEQEHAIEHERSRIAKDIHDDLGANLTQIVLLSQRAGSAGSNPQEAAHWLQKIPATARQTIRSLDEIVWAVNPQHDSLESLANYLSQFALEHLALAGIRCHLEVPTVLPAVRLGAEVRHNCVLTVREALQNVVTHAAATEATVALEVNDEHLKITVKDNGHGFDRAQIKLGNGLANMRRRIEDIGGHIEITSQSGRGTTVQLTLRLNRLAQRAAPKSN